MSHSSCANSDWNSAKRTSRSASVIVFGATGSAGRPFVFTTRTPKSGLRRIGERPLHAVRSPRPLSGSLCAQGPGPRGCGCNGRENTPMLRRRGSLRSELSVCQILRLRSFSDLQTLPAEAAEALRTITHLDRARSACAHRHKGLRWRTLRSRSAVRICRSASDAT
jgi:hypothetical protein